MRNEPAVRRENTPAQAMMKATGAIEAANSSLFASSAYHRRQYPALGADASAPQVIRQLR
jgi:hypothetical protein